MSGPETNIIERTASKPMVSPFMAKVVGLTFAPGYPRNILQDGSIKNIRLLAVLDNEYDEHAVAVIGNYDTRIGWLPRAIASRLQSELIENHESWTAEVVEVLVHPDNPNNPGLLIRCRRKEQPDG